MSSLMNEYIGVKFRKFNTSEWVIVGGSCRDYSSGREHTMFKYLDSDTGQPIGETYVMSTFAFFETFAEEKELA